MAAEKEKIGDAETFLQTILDLSNKLPVKPYFSAIAPVAKINLTKNNCTIILEVRSDYSMIDGFVRNGSLMLPLQKISDFSKKVQTQRFSQLVIKRSVGGDMARVFSKVSFGCKYPGDPSKYVNGLLKYLDEVFNSLKKMETIIDEFRKFDVSFDKLKEILSNAIQERDKNRKGTLFEDFARNLVQLDENFQIEGIDVNTESEEIDMVLGNLGVIPFYAQLQSPMILVECKNWTSKVGANEIRDFAQKIQNRPRFLCKVGFMITTSELTSDAFKELIGYRGGDFIIAVAEGKDLNDFINKKIYFSEFLMDKIRLAGLR